MRGKLYRYVKVRILRDLRVDANVSKYLEKWNLKVEEK